MAVFLSFLQIQDLVNQFFSPPSLQHQSLSIEATAIPNSSSVNKSNNNNSNNTKEITSTDSGIQVGSESLSSCDTPVGDSTTDTGDSDCENEPENANNARQVKFTNYSIFLKPIVTFFPSSQSSRSD